MKHTAKLTPSQRKLLSRPKQQSHEKPLVSEIEKIVRQYQSKQKEREVRQENRYIIKDYSKDNGKLYDEHPPKVGPKNSKKESFFDILKLYRAGKKTQERLPRPASPIDDDLDDLIESSSSTTQPAGSSSIVESGTAQPSGSSKKSSVEDKSSKKNSHLTEPKDRVVMRSKKKVNNLRLNPIHITTQPANDVEIVQPPSLLTPPPTPEPQNPNLPNTTGRRLRVKRPMSYRFDDVKIEGLDDDKANLVPYRPKGFVMPTVAVDLSAVVPPQKKRRRVKQSKVERVDPVVDPATTDISPNEIAEPPTKKIRKLKNPFAPAAAPCEPQQSAVPIKSPQISVNEPDEDDDRIKCRLMKFNFEASMFERIDLSQVVMGAPGDRIVVEKPKICKRKQKIPAPRLLTKAPIDMLKEKQEKEALLKAQTVGEDSSEDDMPLLTEVEGPSINANVATKVNPTIAEIVPEIPISIHRAESAAAIEEIATALTESSRDSEASSVVDSSPSDDATETIPVHPDKSTEAKDIASLETDDAVMNLNKILSGMTKAEPTWEFEDEEFTSVVDFTQPPEFEASDEITNITSEVELPSSESSLPQLNETPQQADESTGYDSDNHEVIDMDIDETCNSERHLLPPSTVDTPIPEPIIEEIRTDESIEPAAIDEVLEDIEPAYELFDDVLKSDFEKSEDDQLSPIESEENDDIEVIVELSENGEILDIRSSLDDPKVPILEFIRLANGPHKEEEFFCFNRAEKLEVKPAFDRIEKMKQEEETKKKNKRPYMKKPEPVVTFKDFKPKTEKDKMIVESFVHNRCPGLAALIKSAKIKQAH